MVGSDGRVVAAGDGCLVRARGDGVAAGKLLENAEDLLIDGRRNNAGLALLGSEEVEDITVGDETTVVGAGINGLLESVNIPSVDKVTVEPVASWVTLSKDERLAVSVPLVLEIVDAVEHLVEERDHVDGVGVGALAVVQRAAHRVSHVRLVVSRVKVHTIPARWEEDLSTKTVRAVCSRHARGLRTRSGVIEAHEADGLGSKVISTVALERVTSDHAEALGESLEGVIVRSRTLEVVDGHATVDTVTITNLRNVLEGTVLVLVVKLWGPVVGKILLDRAGRADRGTSLGVVHFKSEAIASRNGVDVSGNSVRADDGVCTLSENATWAWHSEESRCRCSKSGDQAESSGAGSVHLERYTVFVKRR